jgi:hypothetical protein
MTRVCRLLAEGMLLEFVEMSMLTMLSALPEA